MDKLPTTVLRGTIFADSYVAEKFLGGFQLDNAKVAKTLPIRKFVDSPSNLKAMSNVYLFLTKK